MFGDRAAVAAADGHDIVDAQHGGDEAAGYIVDLEPSGNTRPVRSGTRIIHQRPLRATSISNVGTGPPEVAAMSKFGESKAVTLADRRSG